MPADANFVPDKSEKLRDEARAVLERALTLFGADDTGVFLAGEFGKLRFSMHVNPEQLTKHQSDAHRHLVAVNLDLWNIACLVERLEFLNTKALSDQEIYARWRHYMSLDVAHIYVELRSLFDHIACAFRSMSSKPGVLPESFEKLVNKLGSYRGPLGPLANVLSRDFGFFTEIRRVRTEIEHRGAEAMVFEKPGPLLLFQIHSMQYRDVIRSPEFAMEGTVVRLDRYLAFYLAQLIVFLDEVSVAFMGTLQLARPLQASHSYAPGFGVLVSWMKDLRSYLGVAAPSRS